MPIMYVRPPGRIFYPHLGQDQSDTGEAGTAAPPPANVTPPPSPAQPTFGQWWSGQTFGIPNPVLIGIGVLWIWTRRTSGGGGGHRRYRD
jgi:hypothetical protein